MQKRPSPIQLTSAVTVNGIFAKHVELSVLGDDAAAAVVTCRVHGRLGLQFDHLLGLVRLGLSATFSCEKKEKKNGHQHQHFSRGVFDSALRKRRNLLTGFSVLPLAGGACEEHASVFGHQQCVRAVVADRELDDFGRLCDGQFHPLAR